MIDGSRISCASITVMQGGIRTGAERGEAGVRRGARGGVVRAVLRDVREVEQLAVGALLRADLRRVSRARWAGGRARRRTAAPSSTVRPASLAIVNCRACPAPRAKSVGSPARGARGWRAGDAEGEGRTFDERVACEAQ